MAIQNASDLLVYKKTSPAQPQITRIKIKATTPIKDFTLNDNIILNNVTDASGDISDGVVDTLSGVNSGFSLCSSISAVLTGSYGYTATGVINDPNDSSFKKIDVTNGADGPVPTLEVLSGTAEFKAGAVEIIVLQPGQSLVYQPIAYSTSASISMSTDLRDITTKDSQGWQENAKGLGSFEMSTDALWDVNNAVGVESATTDLIQGDSVDIKFSDRVRNLVDTEEVYGEGWIDSGITKTKHLEDPFGQFTAAKFKVSSDGASRFSKYVVPISLVEGKMVTFSFYIKKSATTTSAAFRLRLIDGSGTTIIPNVSSKKLDGDGSVSLDGTAVRLSGLTTNWSRFSVTTDSPISGADLRELAIFTYPGSSITSQTTADEFITASWQVETGTSASDYQNPTEVDCYQGKAFVNSVSIDAGTEENATYSASFTGTSELFVNGLGHELIADPYFDDGTNVWSTAGESTISNGVARIYSSAGVLSEIFILNTVVVGKKYCLEYTVSSYTSGKLAISGVEETIPSSVGTHKVHFTAAVLTKFSLKRDGGGVTDISLNYVSLKEVFS